MFLRKMRSERGSVMMEYVILNFFFVVAIAVAGYFFVSPDGGTAGQNTYRVDPSHGGLRSDSRRTERYGILGNAFKQHYDLMLLIVSMPYP